MRQYNSSTELIDGIMRAYALFNQEFDQGSEEHRSKRIDAVDKSPREMLAYQLGWLNLVMGWEKDERDGKNVQTPAPGYKWNCLGPLYQSFYDQYADKTLAELRGLLRESVREWCERVRSLSDEELFMHGVRKWKKTEYGK